MAVTKLVVQSGWRVRRSERAEASNLRRSGEGFEALRRIRSREELCLLVEKGASSPPNAAATVPARFYLLFSHLTTLFPFLRR